MVIKRKLNIKPLGEKTIRNLTWDGIVKTI